MYFEECVLINSYCIEENSIVMHYYMAHSGHLLLMAILHSTPYSDSPETEAVLNHDECW